MLKFFDRYLLREIGPPFFIGLLVYTFVLLMNQVLLLSELFIARGVAPDRRPDLPLPRPVGAGLRRPHVRADGHPGRPEPAVVRLRDRRLPDPRHPHPAPARPVFVFAFAGWLVTSALTLYLAPWANFKWVQTLTESVLAKVQLHINPREFNEIHPEDRHLRPGHRPGPAGRTSSST